MTVEELKSQTRKDLAGMAKVRGVAGWHAMRKEELVRALRPLVRRESRKPATRDNGSAVKSPRNGLSPAGRNGASNRTAATPKTNGHKKNGNGSLQKNGKNGTHQPRSKPTSPALKDLAAAGEAETPTTTDRLFVVAHDAYWLHALWELRHSTIERAEAGLGIEWHTARPIIRVWDVSSDETRHCVEKHVRDVEIHGGINHWYIEVTDPPGVYQLQIGYLTAAGRFFSLARSEVVETLAVGTCGMLNENWSDIAKKDEDSTPKKNRSRDSRQESEVRELFDQRLRRPMNAHAVTNFLLDGDEEDDLKLNLDAELIVYGSTKPKAKLTVAGEEVKLREDGTFTIRLSLRDGRQVIPAAVVSPSGARQQTVILAVERNTKHLEMQHFDGTEA